MNNKMDNKWEIEELIYKFLLMNMYKLLQINHQNMNMGLKHNI